MVWGEKLDSRLRGVVRQFYERYLPGKLPTLSG
jgi:hypothetical protein